LERPFNYKITKKIQIIVEIIILATNYFKNKIIFCNKKIKKITEKETLFSPLLYMSHTKTSFIYLFL